MSSHEVHMDPQTVGSKIACPYCPQTFVRTANLTRHLKTGICTKPKKSKKDLERELERVIQVKDERYEELANSMAKQFQHVQQQIDQRINEHPAVANTTNNQHLNIMCLGSNDNLLDMLAKSEGGLHNALTFMRGCALSRLAGDCRILEKAYGLTTINPAIMTTDKKRTQYVYYDERRRRQVEGNIKVMGKKLASILQTAYGKAMDMFNTDLSGNHKELVPYNSSQLPKLDPYDLNLWNEHVHELQTDTYQVKLLKNLSIQKEPKRD